MVHAIHDQCGGVRRPLGNEGGQGTRCGYLFNNNNNNILLLSSPLSSLSSLLSLSLFPLSSSLLSFLCSFLSTFPSLSSLSFLDWFLILLCLYLKWCQCFRGYFSQLIKSCLFFDIWKLTKLKPKFWKVYNISFSLFHHCFFLSFFFSINIDRWLNANLPLDRQNFHSEGWLILYPIVTLASKV